MPSAAFQLSARRGRKRANRAALDSLRLGNHLDRPALFLQPGRLSDAEASSTPRCAAKVFPADDVARDVVVPLVGADHRDRRAALLLAYSWRRTRTNAGNPALAWRWMGEWLLGVDRGVRPDLSVSDCRARGFSTSLGARRSPSAVIVIAAVWIVLALNSSPQSSNAHLVDRHRRRTRSADAAERVGHRVARAEAADCVDRARAPSTARRCRPKPRGWRAGPFSLRALGFWMSFPMLFFMAAADHYPFLSGVAN